MERRKEIEKNLDVSFGEVGLSGSSNAERSRHLQSQAKGTKERQTANSGSSNWNMQDSDGNKNSQQSPYKEVQGTDSAYDDTE